MKPLSHWIGDLARSKALGSFMLWACRVGEVGHLQLANTEGGGVFYRAAKSAVEWMFHYSPGRYYRLAGYIDWLVNRRLVEGPGAFLPLFYWRSLAVEFKDFGDEDLSAVILARGLVEQAFLMKFRYTGKELSDEQLLRIGRLAQRDAERFLDRFERDWPELAQRVRELHQAFDPQSFLASQRMRFSQKIRYVPRRARAGELPAGKASPK